MIEWNKDKDGDYVGSIGQVNVFLLSNVCTCENHCSLKSKLPGFPRHNLPKSIRDGKRMAKEIYEGFLRLTNLTETSSL